MMEPWYWHDSGQASYLKCRLLDAWAHGFFTRQFQGRSPENLVELLQPGATAYRTKQVHGNRVMTPSEIDAELALDPQSEVANVAEGDRPNADGVLTERGRQAAWVCSADCTPVFVADTTTKQVAAIHAGWRGTASKIVPLAIDRLQKQGSNLRDLRIALGPAIAGEVYQVSEAVAAEVGATVLTQPMDSVAGTLSALTDLPRSPILPDPEPGKVRLDVRCTIALQLERLDIDAEQMAIAPHCTYQLPQHFFSYRRDGQKHVQWSGIVSGG